MRFFAVKKEADREADRVVDQEVDQAMMETEWKLGVMKQLLGILQFTMLRYHGPAEQLQEI